MRWSTYVFKSWRTLAASSAGKKPELENSQDPKRTRTVQDFLQRKFIIEPHSTARKSIGKGNVFWIKKHRKFKVTWVLSEGAATGDHVSTCRLGRLLRRKWRGY
jgi:hypothetical protein